MLSRCLTSLETTSIGPYKKREETSEKRRHKKKNWTEDSS